MRSRVCPICGNPAVRPMMKERYCLKHWQTESKARLKALSEVSSTIGSIFTKSSDIEEFSEKLKYYSNESKINTLLKMIG